MVNSIKQSPVLKGHLSLVLPLTILYDLSLFQKNTCLKRPLGLRPKGDLLIQVWLFIANYLSLCCSIQTYCIALIKTLTLVSLISTITVYIMSPHLIRTSHYKIMFIIIKLDIVILYVRHWPYGCVSAIFHAPFVCLENPVCYLKQYYHETLQTNKNTIYIVHNMGNVMFY